MYKGIKLVSISLLLAFIYTLPVHACDGGCPTVTNYYNGLFPQYQKHFLGFRMRYNSISSLGGHSDLGLTAQSKESFYSMELMGRFYPHKRLQILAFVPFNLNQLSSPSQQETVAGLGDISILAFYNIFNSDFKDSSRSKLLHSLQIGGGIKLPTGSFDQQGQDDLLLSPTFQLGTGSTDFILSSIYTLRYQKVGFNSNITYKINLANRYQYKIGNQLSGRLTGFGLIQFDQWLLVPQIGLQIENTAKNRSKEFVRTNTGGTQLLSIVGLGIYYKKIQIGLSYEQPIWQQIANGQVQNHARFMASINYLF